MRSPLENLTKKERELLANFYNTETYKALRKLIDEERIHLAQDHVDLVDILQVRYLSGQTQSLKKLILTLKANSQTMNKDS